MSHTTATETVDSIRDLLSDAVKQTTNQWTLISIDHSQDCSKLALLDAKNAEVWLITIQAANFEVVV